MAQLAAQKTLNLWVGGSNPSRLAKEFKMKNIWTVVNNGYAVFLAGFVYFCVIGGSVGSFFLISSILIERIQGNL